MSMLTFSLFRQANASSLCLAVHFNWQRQSKYASKVAAGKWLNHLQNVRQFEEKDTDDDCRLPASNIIPQYYFDHMGTFIAE